MRGGKRKRVKRLHIDTLFSSGKITQSLHQELTSFTCAFHSGVSTECFANYIYPLEIAVAARCNLLGDEQLALSTLATGNLWATAQECLRTKRCLPALAQAVPQEIVLQVSLLSQSPCVVFGKWLGIAFRQGCGHFCPGRVPSNPCSSATIPVPPTPDCGEAPVPSALLVGLPQIVLVLGSSAPNSCLAEWGSTDEVLFCVWSPQGLCLPGDLRACLTASLKAQPLEEQCHLSHCQPGQGDLSVVSCSAQEPLNPLLPSPQQIGGGEQGRGALPSLLWKLLYFASNNYRFIRGR